MRILHYNIYFVAHYVTLYLYQYTAIYIYIYIYIYQYKDNKLYLTQCNLYSRLTYILKSQIQT